MANMYFFVAHTHAHWLARIQRCGHIVYRNTNIISNRQKSEINSFISIVCWFWSSSDIDIHHIFHHNRTHTINFYFKHTWCIHLIFNFYSDSFIFCDEWKWLCFLNDFSCKLKCSIPVKKASNVSHGFWFTFQSRWKFNKFCHYVKW